MKNASDQDYPKTIDVVVGEGAPTTETGSTSTLPTPEKTQPTLNSMPCSLKAESTDGEACFPAQDSSGSIRSFDDCDYDGSDADVTMETVSDAGYLSNGSTYGSSCQSADEYSSETETGDLSTEESETSSYEMIDVDEQDCSNFRSHTGGNKGKRNAGHLNDGCGGNSDNNFGRKKGGSGGDGSDGRRKRARGGNSPLSNAFSDDESEVKLLACPYFKHDPTTCTATAYPDLSRVKGHVLRAHLKPLQCDRCGEFRAGDQGQIRKHLRDNNCEKATEFVPVNEAIVKKGEDLKKTSGKAKTWQRVYMILFECSLEEVPSPYAEPAVKLSPQTEAAVAAESSAAQPPALPQHVQLATINDNGFAEYAQQELSRRISAQLPALIAGELPAIISAYTESMRLKNSASGQFS
ncbi:hypothetical protein FPQ18DRAFT_317544 [Pyronema domesticum]|nr:hypothetical protein FPQ18DRAFT_317544 [Pyronema domesticum]